VYYCTRCTQIQKESYHLVIAIRLQIKYQLKIADQVSIEDHIGVRVTMFILNAQTHVGVQLN